ncbi:LAMI_0D06832g1_1 [Lachancea mirantina]|uniref:LAMI_0D06832g1_1 n=1 Tax=Lachancea mirantina TaxID=1230905 RepID=A0A1G4JBY9_9SACH|nr:LAMI_0D06832g1_1 [Lachancea mirantina]
MLKNTVSFARKPFYACSKRHILIPSSKTRKRQRQTHYHNKINEELNLEKGLDWNNVREVSFKLKQLKEFTKNLAQQVRNADDLMKKQTVEQEVVGPKKVIDHEIRPALESPRQAGGSELSSLILNASEQAKKFLPDVLLKRICDDQLVLKSLLDRRNRNWNPILSRIYGNKEWLNGVSQKVLKTSLLPSLKGLNLTNIKRLDEMLMANIENDITRFSLAMYECLFLNLSNLKVGGIEVFEMMDMLLKRHGDAISQMDSDGLQKKSEMSQFVMNCCIKVASKAMNFEKMDQYLTLFGQKYGLIPNRENYTAIIQFYTKLNVPSRAWDLFSTMKFLSTQHKPDITTYNAMLNLCGKERDYAKTIDLHQEMLDQGIKPNTQTLNLMARSLAMASADPITSEGKSESLRLLGWKYIHEVELDLESNYGQNARPEAEETLISMMALSAYDGDVAMARALYFRLVTAKFKQAVNRWQAKNAHSSELNYKSIWQKALNPIAFNYLLLSYANYSRDKLPLLLGYDQGAILRRNVLNSVDYVSRSEANDLEAATLPLLPTKDLNNAWQIMSESRALWHFNLEYGGQTNITERPPNCTKDWIDTCKNTIKTKEELLLEIAFQIANWRSAYMNDQILNSKLLTSFLTIPLKLGDKKEFELRLSEFSYEQQDLEALVNRLFGLDQNALTDENISSDLVCDGDSSEISAKDLDYFGSFKHKLIRTSNIYELVMRAALKFNDMDLATQAWDARGKFRKTNLFTNQSAALKQGQDKVFAELTVHFFTQRELLTDAMGIIMASQKYLDWKYPAIRGLHQKLKAIEDTKSEAILLDIVNKKTTSKSEIDFALGGKFCKQPSSRAA